MQRKSCFDKIRSKNSALNQRHFLAEWGLCSLESRASRRRREVRLGWLCPSLLLQACRGGGGEGRGGPGGRASRPILRAPQIMFYGVGRPRPDTGLHSGSAGHGHVADTSGRTGARGNNRNGEETLPAAVTSRRQRAVRRAACDLILLTVLASFIAPAMAMHGASSGPFFGAGPHLDPPADQMARTRQRLPPIRPATGKGRGWRRHRSATAGSLEAARRGTRIRREECTL